jgi:hypothetical protein
MPQAHEIKLDRKWSEALAVLRQIWFGKFREADALLKLLKFARAPIPRGLLPGNYLGSQDEAGLGDQCQDPQALCDLLLGSFALSRARKTMIEKAIIHELQYAPNWNYLFGSAWTSPGIFRLSWVFLSKTM